VVLIHVALDSPSRILESRSVEMSGFLRWKNTFATYISEWVELGHSVETTILRGVRLREAVKFLDSPYHMYFSESERHYILSRVRRRQQASNLL